MIKHKKYSLAVLTAALVVLGAVSYAGQGQGDVKVGYVFTDETGNRTVNQETYNVYEGFGLSLNNFTYGWDNGVGFDADLERITLNNRNLRFSAYRPGLFQVSGTNNQYRRFYDADGVYFTRRQSTGLHASVTPTKHFKFFGGFTNIKKHGENITELRPIPETNEFSSDYSSSTYNVGAQGFCPYGSLRVEYGSHKFTDNLTTVNDRTANTFTATAFSSVPKYRWITLAGGYIYRQDKADSYGTTKLTTNQGWGATKIFLPYRFIAEYRVVAARTKHEARETETDNYINTVSVGKSWKKFGGLRVGYENRVADDLVDRSESDALLCSGWLKLYDFNAKGSFTLRNKDIVDGQTLVGGEDYVRHTASIQYVYKGWGDVSGSWERRLRQNDDINSQVDYNAVSSTLNFERSQYGRLTFTYSYYVGKYENRSDATSYEFSDHIFTGMLTPKSYRHYTVSVGGTYWRGYRDQSIEKFSLNLMGRYDLPHGHAVEVKYDVFNYDNYLLANNFYTGNIVEVNLIKSISL